jgi:uncharacterized protein
VDASAIAKLIRREPESDAVREHLGGFVSLTTSRLAVVELGRLAQREGIGGTQVQAVLRAFALVEVSAPIARRAAELPGPALRALDAVHLATALALGDDLGAFVVYDRRLRIEAERLGLPVTSPGV